MAAAPCHLLPEHDPVRVCKSPRTYLLLCFVHPSCFPCAASDPMQSFLFLGSFLFSPFLRIVSPSPQKTGPPPSHGCNSQGVQPSRTKRARLAAWRFAGLCRLPLILRTGYAFAGPCRLPWILILLLERRTPHRWVKRSLAF